MTDLVNPTIENEVASDNPHAACGPACVASIINDAHKGPVTVTQVNDWMATNLGATTGGVPVSWLQQALAHWGVSSAIRSGAMKPIVNAAIAANHEVIIWHQCNGCADPVTRYATTTSHFRVAYGAVVTMNPGYAFCGRAPLENVDCSVGDMGTHLEIMEVLPKDLPPTPQPQQEDDDMASILGVTKGPNGEEPGVWLLSGSMYVHIDDPTTLAGFNAAGIKGGTIDYGQHLILAANSSTAVLNAIQKLAGPSGSGHVSGTLTIS